MAIDDQFINTFGIDIVKGRNFTQSDTSFMNNQPGKLTKVLVNEEIVKALDYKSNEDAINKNMVLILGPREVNCTIIGVVKNYHQRSLKRKIRSNCILFSCTADLEILYDEYPNS